MWNTILQIYIVFDFLIRICSNKDDFYIISEHRNSFNGKVKKLKAVAKQCSVKRVFLEITQNSQENTCGRVSFLTKLQVSRFVFLFYLVQYVDTAFMLKKVHWVQPGVSTWCFLVLPTIHNLKKTETISNVISETFFIKNST